MVKIANAEVAFEGSQIKLSPFSIVNDANESALFNAGYDIVSGEMHASLSSEGMAIASLRRQIAAVGAPVIGMATAGSWSGGLQYSRPGRGDDTGVVAGWTGEVHLKDMDIPFEAFAQPIHVLEADASLDATGAAMKKVRLTVAGIAAQGDYRYEIGATRPHLFHMVLPTASADELEAALTPTLHRADLLTYAFNFGRVPQPDWLRDMHADGSIQMTTLTLGGTQLANLKANLLWDGPEVELTGLSAKLGAAALTGDAAIHLAGRQPAYEVTGAIAGFAWQGGTVAAKGVMSASGMGGDLLSNLKAQGTLTGKRLEVAPLSPWETVEGTFDFSVTKATPRLKLTDLTIQSGGTKWTGGAETQDNGQVVFKFANGARNMEASGAVLRGEALKAVR